MVDPEALAAWVAQSCHAQGVPERVTDPGVLGRVGALLGAVPERTDASAAGAPRRAHSRHTGTSRAGSIDLAPGVPGRTVA